MIYLDTHVVVWSYAGALEKISDEVKTIINKADLVISPVVRLELQYLFEIGRITIESNTIVTELEDLIGLNVCDKTFNTIINSALKINWTRDPFDRIIVANAAINIDRLISKDQTILDHYDQAVW